MAPAILIAFVVFRPDPLVLASMFTIGAVALSLYLLPRLKGMIVAVQWAKRMHGFGAPRLTREPMTPTTAPPPRSATPPPSSPSAMPPDRRRGC